MGRKPIPILELSRGISSNNPYRDNLQLIRLLGFKFGNRDGSLESRGGWADWATATQIDKVLGLKKWYRQDGGTNFLAFAIPNSTGVPNLYYYSQHNKTITSLTTYTELMDTSCPVGWIDCGNQLIAVTNTQTGRALSVKLNEFSPEGGLLTRLLGLDPPSGALGFVFGQIPVGTNSQIANGLADGTYQYCYTRCYGTRRSNELYGESAPSNVATAKLAVGANDTGIIQVVLPESLAAGGAVQKFNIYRTKAGQTTFYKVGEVTHYGAIAFNDTLKDSLIDTSKVLPTATGIPTGIRVAKWHSTLARLFWFGADGYFHYSAAGYPDINQASSKLAVGDTGFPGNGIAFIRGNIYVFKEDGIFLVTGAAPNYTSVLIDATPCVALNTTVEMPDGVYFLGAHGEQLKVFRFDGSVAEPVSEAKINHVIGRKKADKLLKAFAKKVGVEYCLNIRTSDFRYCFWPEPFNTVSLYYNIIKQQWTAAFTQAACMETFDGPADSGEVWMGEADPTADVNKGSFFRQEQYRNSVPTTSHTNGTRLYSKATNFPRKLAFELVNAFGENRGLQKQTLHALLLRSRFYPGASPVLQMFSDSEEFGANTQYSVDTEPSFGVYDEMVLAGDGAGVLGTGKLDTMVINENPFEEVQFNTKDTFLRTGGIFELIWQDPKLYDIVVDAIEPKLESNLDE